MGDVGDVGDVGELLWSAVDPGEPLGDRLSGAARIDDDD